MNKKAKFSVFTAFSTLAATTALGWVGASAKALTLTSSSGTWDNVVMIRGEDTFQGIANPGIPNNLGVDFQEVNGESQVRWGNPDNSQNPEKIKSGLGFTGVANKNFDIGEIFEIGTLKHFNFPVGDPVAAAADLTINLDFEEPNVSQAFTFTFDIDETFNTGPLANCPGNLNPCPDTITFPSAFPSQSFKIDGVSFTLELLGFSQDEGQTIISEFVTEEKQTTPAKLFGRISAVETPEPTTGFGLLALGTLGAGSILKCKQK